jgi:hypothetical protein
MARHPNRAAEQQPDLRRRPLALSQPRLADSALTTADLRLGASHLVPVN